MHLNPHVATLKMAAAAMSDPKSIASEVAKRLNITTATLYTYVNSDGSLKTAGTKLLNQPLSIVSRLYSD